MPEHTLGLEWTNGRGQVFVYTPDHMNARKDGFVARSRLVVEKRDGRILKQAERVLHWPDEDPSNDEPDNLLVFESHSALMAFRTAEYAKRKKEQRLTVRQELTVLRQKLESALAVELAEHESAPKSKKELDAFLIGADVARTLVTEALE